MAKTWAGVLAVSIAALLFAGCGGEGSKLTPAQKERCDRLESLTRTADSVMQSPEYDIRAQVGAAGVIEEYSKERAQLGC
jgi:hypothetical protein